MENQVNQEKKPIILSGIQPTGKLHIGHLTGALQNWVKLQETYNCYYTIVDLHAITLKQVPAELRRSSLDLAALFIACGINPETSILFLQSSVPEHTQLSWILTCSTGVGELERMTQYKDKSKRNEENINAGLLTYPVLMAADILLYQANLVPVGEDQKQHLELARNLAQRFNFHYSDTFTIPEPYIPPVGARIMSLNDPTRKMSKSDANEQGTIFLVDDDKTIIKKIQRAVTDSGSEIKNDPNRPGIANLMSLYHIATGRSFDDIELEFKGKGYAEFKPAVGQAVADYIRPIREKYLEIRNNEAVLKQILIKGAEEARKQAFKTLRKVYKKVGFYSLS